MTAQSTWNSFVLTIVADDVSCVATEYPWEMYESIA